MPLEARSGKFDEWRVLLYSFLSSGSGPRVRAVTMLLLEGCSCASQARRACGSWLAERRWWLAGFVHVGCFPVLEACMPSRRIFCIYFFTLVSWILVIHFGFCFDLFDWSLFPIYTNLLLTKKKISYYKVLIGLEASIRVYEVFRDFGKFAWTPPFENIWKN